MVLLIGIHRTKMYSKTLERCSETDLREICSFSLEATKHPGPANIMRYHFWTHMRAAGLAAQAQRSENKKGRETEF
jgi:hypothetical protein